MRSSNPGIEFWAIFFGWLFLRSPEGPPANPTDFFFLGLPRNDIYIFFRVCSLFPFPFLFLFFIFHLYYHIIVYHFSQLDTTQLPPPSAWYNTVVGPPIRWAFASSPTCARCACQAGRASARGSPLTLLFYLFIKTSNTLIVDVGLKKGGGGSGVVDWWVVSPGPVLPTRV